MSILSATARAFQAAKEKVISPGKREKYRRYVIALTKAEKIDEQDVGETFAGIPFEKIKADSVTYSKRVQAASDRVVTPEEKQALAEKEREAAAALAKAQEAYQVSCQLGDAYKRLELELHQQRGLIDGRIAAANGVLNSTFDWSAYHEEMANVMSKGGYGALMLEDALRPLRSVPDKLASEEESLARLKARQSEIKDAEGMEASTERAFLNAQIAATKQRVKELKELRKQHDELQGELSSIEAKRAKLGERMYEPEHFKIDFGIPDKKGEAAKNGY